MWLYFVFEPNIRFKKKSLCWTQCLMKGHTARTDTHTPFNSSLSSVYPYNPPTRIALFSKACIFFLIQTFKTAFQTQVNALVIWIQAANKTRYWSVEEKLRIIHFKESCGQELSRKHGSPHGTPSETALKKHKDGRGGYIAVIICATWDWGAFAGGGAERSGARGTGRAPFVWPHLKLPLQFLYEKRTQPK